MTTAHDLYIREFKNVFDPGFCQKVILRHQGSNDSFKDIVFWKEKNINQDWSDLLPEIEIKLNKCIDQYFADFKSDISHKEVELMGFGVMRQPPGAYDVQHFDTPVATQNGKLYYRPFVCLIYLNGDDLTGGQLLFPAQQRVIEPELGKVLLFPCSYMYPHRVATLSNGVRAFIRVNYRFKSDSMIDMDLDNWDITVDGIQHSD